METGEKIFCLSLDTQVNCLSGNNLTPAKRSADAVTISQSYCECCLVLVLEICFSQNNCF